MKIIKVKEIEKILLEEDFGIELDSVKALIDNEVVLDFSLVPCPEKTATGDYKFEIHAIINKSDRLSNVVITSRKKKPRQVTFKFAFEQLKELGVKSFQVVLKNEQDEIEP